VHFLSVMDDLSNVISLLQHLVRLISTAKRDENNRNILTMGIVHIFCRNPQLVASALSGLTLPGGGDGLTFMIDTWFELHPLLESRYNRHISSLGMMHVMEMYLAQGVGEAFLHRVLQSVVQAVGAVENDDTGEVYRSMCSLSCVLPPFCIDVV
jgi:hypothetical protein